ncbi:uncharacterized protein LOC129760836 [Uranotaenia lowii]|uniref:uncharacterized protein LOC129760836 n=1 Tax=Uranotaenia lowii TaxID=190385 RepID=UPI00247A4BC2|nr:uncharacterized protein LOC129760836 [Uranotaenia lowii]
MSAKTKGQIECCVKCILAERKRGKPEGLLSPISKGEVPFETYHVDHLGPMDVIEKQYKYHFVIVDAFTKFVWIYPAKTTNGQEVIQKLRLQSELFGILDESSVTEVRRSHQVTSRSIVHRRTSIKSKLRPKYQEETAK